MTVAHPQIMGSSGPVVVGATAGTEGREALMWAARAAADRDVTLRIVRAFRVRTMAEAAGAALREYDIARRAAWQRVHHARRVVLETYPGLDVEVVAAAGRPSVVLRRNAGDASVLVIATRRQSNLVQALAGSVTNRLTGRVRCPVMSLPILAPT